MNKQRQETIVMTRFPYVSSWGGEESHTLDLARYLREQGKQVVFMGSCTILLKKFEEEGFETISVWGGRMIVTPWQLIKSLLLFPFITWSMKKAFRNLQRKHLITAVYSLSLNEKLFLTPYLLSQGIPVTWVEHQEIRNWLLKSPWKRRYKKYAGQVQIVPISKKNESVLLGSLHIPKKNMHFIINGIDTDAFKPSKKIPGSLLAANRLIPKKGVRDIVQALKILQGHEEFSAKILGEGEEERSIKNEIQAMNNKNIQFNNFLKKENWKKALSEAEMFISSSRDSNETFSLNCAEALSSGCKLVITSCTGIADFVKGKKGVWICEPNNPKDMAEKIQQALDEKNDLSQQLSAFAHQTFNQERMHKEYFSLILRK